MRKHEFMQTALQDYVNEADDWSEKRARNGAMDFFSELDVSPIDDDELLAAAEESYNGVNDWPQVRSIRDGITILASESLCNEFLSLVNDFVDDLDDFRGLYAKNPYAGDKPDAVYEDGEVMVYWSGSEHVAIAEKASHGLVVFTDVSDDYDFDDDAILQLKRSSHEQEDEGGGKACGEV
jgi:hypothetical protein